MGQVNQILDITRDDLLKCAQYSALFCTWYAEKNNNAKGSRFAFLLYQKLFHSRRIFRLCKFIVFLPRLKQMFNDLRKSCTFRGVFSFLGKLFLVLFYFFDNAAILMMLTGNPYYRAIRRLSYSILLIGILWKIFAISIELKISFNSQSKLKQVLDEQSPKDILECIAKIDFQRKRLMIHFLFLIGDLLPTLARTNLPEILLRTTINKGTVGVFGIVAGFSSIYLKMIKK